MRIGELADATAVGIQTLRYYERIGLLLPARRRPSGFRVYDEQATRRVRFIRRAQDLGFTLREIAELLALWGQTPRVCAAVQDKARATRERIALKIRDLNRMQRGLEHYLSACGQQSTTDECPLLIELGGEHGPKK